MYRIVVAYFDPADPDAFDARYRDEHVALVRAIPGLVDFSLSHPRGLSGVTPYLVAEMSFADEEAVANALTVRGDRRSRTSRGRVRGGLVRHVHLALRASPEHSRRPASSAV